MPRVDPPKYNNPNGYSEELLAIWGVELARVMDRLAHNTGDLSNLIDQFEVHMNRRIMSQICADLLTQHFLGKPVDWPAFFAFADYVWTNHAPGIDPMDEMFQKIVDNLPSIGSDLTTIANNVGSGGNIDTNVQAIRLACAFLASPASAGAPHPW